MIGRNFIKNITMAGAGLTLAPALLSLSCSAEPPQKKKERGFPPVASGYDMEIPPQPAMRFEKGERALMENELVDILAIQRLQMTYAQLHEHGTADEIAALFHPDAELYALYLVGKGFKGRQQIRDWYAWWLEVYSEDGEYYRHRPMNQIIDLNGDKAVSNSILVAEGVPRDNVKWTIAIGRYVHELLRYDGGWLFWRSWIILHSFTDFSPRTKNPEPVLV